MRFVLLDTAATLAVDLPARADATPTFVVRNPAGGTVQASASVTLGTSNTTLSGAASAGATSVSVTSASGITAGRKYLVGGREDEGGERVTVRSVSATTVTLARALRAAKASGAAFQSTRVEMAVASTTPSAVGRHWRAEVTWAVSSASQPTHVVAFDVVRFQPVSTLDGDAIADLDPTLAKRLPAGTWLPGVLDQCWDMVLRRVAQQKNPGSLVGTLELTTAHAYLVRATLAETGGEDWAAYRDDMRQRFKDELDAALGAAAIDDDGDGSVEQHEGWRRTVLVERG